MLASPSSVVVSHDLNTVKETCNRAMWMKRGRVELVGEPEAVVLAYTEHVTRCAATRAASLAEPPQAA